MYFRYCAFITFAILMLNKSRYYVYTKNGNVFDFSNEVT